MPVRSLNSSVHRWPTRDEVHAAIEKWALEAARRREGVLRVGYIGSYARGDWGFGSDLDIVIIVNTSSLPFVERPKEWDVTDLPVAADLLVYTRTEWTSLPSASRFATMLRHEAVWVYDNE